MTNQDIEVQIKRIRFRSWHRGCKETDLVLGRFADNALAALSQEEITLFEALLEENDNDIWNWLVERQSPPTQYVELMDMLRAHQIDGAGI